MAGMTVRAINNGSTPYEIGVIRINYLETRYLNASKG